MSHPAQFSRREFLKTSARSAGALILGFSLPARAQVREPASGGPFKVFQRNFHDYQVLRINQAPDIEVHIVPSVEDPNGVGELGAMLAPPAVANAVFAATGVRVRRLPIDPQALKRSQS
jgi:CO/xanthine dehydrogenase Mo-binding subunit